ncbi:MAG: DUF1028 domain-containing protein [Alphaproteobacteria bacterium]|nr:DUF1028 domain-containing protein [Alphaproteobacteria bacterium]
MTWSIVARDPLTGAFGVAIATRFFAVGALCPHAMAGKGALSTQAFVNPSFGPRGLQLLSNGASAADVVNALIGDDAGAAVRQLHVVDARGSVAAHTGGSCVGWAGQAAGDQVSVAGNMLAGPAVVDRSLDVYRSSGALGFAERLLRGLEAGEAAGGDKRGKQSAALKIVSTEDYPDIDIRVDDHAEPIAELRRLQRVHGAYYDVFRRHLPRRADPTGTLDRAAIMREIEAHRRGLGLDPSGVGP